MLPIFWWFFSFPNFTKCHVLVNGMILLDWAESHSLPMFLLVFTTIWRVLGVIPNVIYHLHLNTSHNVTEQLHTIIKFVNTTALDTNKRQDMITLSWSLLCNFLIHSNCISHQHCQPRNNYLTGNTFHFWKYPKR